VTFLRLTPGHALAFAAALVLLLFAAMDWYTTDQALEARRLEGLQQSPAGASGRVSESVVEAARRSAESAERNAWQADGLVDRAILAGLLLAAALALVAGFLEAAGRGSDARMTPLTAAAGFATATLVLILLRTLVAPGPEPGLVILPAVPLAAAALAAIALGGALAARSQRRAA
jgi:hypothetical protein